MGDGKTNGKFGAVARSLRAAALGAVALVFQGSGHAGSPVQPIIERARQRVGAEQPEASTFEQLVMERASDVAGFAGHRSHSSHRSHRSHSSHSSSGGGSYQPSPSPSPSPYQPSPSPYQPSPSPAPAPAPVPVELVPEQWTIYRVTLNSGVVHRGTLKDAAPSWILTTVEKVPRVLSVRKSDVKSIARDVP